MICRHCGYEFDGSDSPICPRCHYDNWQDKDEFDPWDNPCLTDDDDEEEDDHDW